MTVSQFVLAVLCVTVAALVPPHYPRPLAATRAYTTTLASSPLEDELFAEVGGAELFAEVGGGGEEWEHDYVRASDDAREVDLNRVNELLSRRLDAKIDRDFDTADALRDELSAVHGVKVWDRERTWTASAPRGRGGARGPRRDLPDAHDYEREGGGDADVDAIDAILLERLHAKMRRDFDRADELREELRALGVRVHDGRKAWKAGVSADAADPWVRAPKAYARVDGDVGLAPGVDAAAVEDAVAARGLARREQRWDEADALLDDLLTLGVDVDDKARTWRPVRTRYARPENLPADLDVAAVEKVIAKRSRFKLRRQFEKADELRGVLNADFDVWIDDRKRTWSLGKPEFMVKAAAARAAKATDDDAAAAAPAAAAVAAPDAADDKAAFASAATGTGVGDLY